MPLLSTTQPSLRARVLPRFPANVVAGGGITITKTGGTYIISASNSFASVAANTLGGPSTTLVSGVQATLLTLNLGQGNWDVDAIAWFNPAAATTVAQLQAFISTAEVPFGGSNFSQHGYNNAVIGANTFTERPMTALTSILTAGTAKLIVTAVFGVSTMKADGAIYARRIG